MLRKNLENIVEIYQQYYIFKIFQQSYNISEEYFYNFSEYFGVGGMDRRFSVNGYGG